MPIGVKSVAAAERHKVINGFDKDEHRGVVVSPLLDKGRFRELIPAAVFRDVQVVFDTVAWGNGSDLDPGYLYERGEALPDAMLFTAEEKIGEEYR